MHKSIKYPHRFFVLLLSILLLSACSSGHPLVPTPNIYSGGGYPAADIPLEQRSPISDFIYITDRVAEQDKKGNLVYKAKRSRSMVVGKISVKFGKDITWPELLKASQTIKRKKTIKLEITKTVELIKFPNTPMPFGMQKGKFITLEPGASDYAAAEQDFQTLLKKELALSRRKEVILFIHGFNNKFADAGLALADLWHFSGRSAVPLFYTWPAANGGLFGYFKDRESGDFTIFHLKELLRMLSRAKGLESIHIIAHSRGTDIITTAMRELVIETRAAGLDPKKIFKISNLFLAAPDMDFGIVEQRLIAEKFGTAFGQITVYMNKGDSALSLSQLLMSGTRFGRMDDDNLSDEDRKIFANVKNVNFINVKGVSGFTGHSYYRTHRGVLSDIAVTIREKAKPGSSQRPLIHNKDNFWTLPKSYLLK